MPKEKENVSVFRVILILFIFLSGMALARAELAMTRSGHNVTAIGILDANYKNIKELLNKMDGKMDIIMGIKQ